MLLSSLNLIAHLVSRLQKTDALTGYQEIKDLMNKPYSF